MYGDVRELRAGDAPTPLWKYVSITHYVDDNVLHHQLTGGYVTGIFDFSKKKGWCSKK